MLKLDMTKDALDTLVSLEVKPFRQVVKAVFALLKNPEPHDSCQLHGHSFRRLDVGEFRVIYRVEGDALKVALVGKRNDDEVYRQLARRG